MTNAPVLGFDTSGAYCGAAVLVDGDVVAAHHEDMSRGQGERLMPILTQVLEAAGLSWGDVGRIGVGVGPGNFTGARIGVSAARGLALGLGIPAVGVSLLDALACGTSGPVLACLAAPRGRAYVAGHRTTAEIAMQLIDPADGPTDWSEPGLVCIGSAAHQMAERLTAEVLPAPFAPASAIARLARERMPKGRPVPLYIRPADAAPPSDPPPVILDA